MVTAWNGLAVAALAQAGAVLGRRDLVAAAETAAAFVLDVHVVDGMLRRTSRGGRVGAAPAVLDDHADLAEGLLVLHQATGGPRWARAAEQLLDQALERFVDAEGTLHDTAHDAPPLFARPAGRTDNAEPAGASALAGALLTHAALTGSTRHRDAAAAALDACGPIAEQDPRFAGWALAVAEAVACGPLQVAVVGDGPCRAGAARHGPGEQVTRAGRGARAPGRTGGTAARGPTTGGGRPGRLRVPRVRLRHPGHDAGRAARRPRRGSGQHRSTRRASPGRRSAEPAGGTPLRVPGGTEERRPGTRTSCCDRRHLGTRQPLQASDEPIAGPDGVTG